MCWWLDVKVSHGTQWPCLFARGTSWLTACLLEEHTACEAEKVFWIWKNGYENVDCSRSSCWNCRSEGFELPKTAEANGAEPLVLVRLATSDGRSWLLFSAERTDHCSFRLFHQLFNRISASTQFLGFSSILLIFECEAHFLVYRSFIKPALLP